MVLFIFYLTNSILFFFKFRNNLFFLFLNIILMIKVMKTHVREYTLISNENTRTHLWNYNYCFYSLSKKPAFIFWTIFFFFSWNDNHKIVGWKIALLRHRSGMDANNSAQASSKHIHSHKYYFFFFLLPTPKH